MINRCPIDGTAPRFNPFEILGNSGHCYDGDHSNSRKYGEYDHDTSPESTEINLPQAGKEEG